MMLSGDQATWVDEKIYRFYYSRCNVIEILNATDIYNTGL